MVTPTVQLLPPDAPLFIRAQWDFWYAMLQRPEFAGTVQRQAQIIQTLNGLSQQAVQQLAPRIQVVQQALQQPSALQQLIQQAIAPLRAMAASIGASIRPMLSAIGVSTFSVLRYWTFFEAFIASDALAAAAVGALTFVGQMLLWIAAAIILLLLLYLLYKALEAFVAFIQDWLTWMLGTGKYALPHQAAALRAIAARNTELAKAAFTEAVSSKGGLIERLDLAMANIKAA